MEPSEENLKNTENAFKDMYSKLHNVPREDIEDISVEDLTKLENSLVNRANTVRFKEVKGVKAGDRKKEDIGKEENAKDFEEKILTPEISETENTKEVEKSDSNQNIVKSSEPLVRNNVPDITDLDKKLKMETASLPEPPDPSKLEENPIVKNDESIKKPEKTELSQPIQVTNVVNEMPAESPLESSNKKEYTSTPLSNIDITPSIPKPEQVLSIDQEQKLRAEYPFVDFDKKPADESEAKWLDQFKKDLLTKINEREKVNIPEVTQNVAIEKSDEERLRKEYPFVDFDKKPADESEAKWLERFKSDLLTTLKERDKQAIPALANPEEPIEKESETTVNPTNNLPGSMAATIDSLKNMNMGNINEMIDQMTAMAMGIQKNAPVNETPFSGTSTSEASLKSISDNISSLNKVNTVSSKELKASIDHLRAVAEQILAYLPNIQAGSFISNNQAQSRDIQPVNTGLLQRYKNEVRQQYGADVIDLSNNRPTMPGFTI